MLTLWFFCAAVNLLIVAVLGRIVWLTNYDKRFFSWSRTGLIAVTSAAAGPFGTGFWAALGLLIYLDV